MTLVLDATVGGAASNSYLTAAAADSYFEGRAFAAAWTAATLAQKEQALVYATSLLDREKWKGAKGATYNQALTQALAWPRRWATTLEFDATPDFVAAADWVDIGTGYYDPAAIPRPLLRATCELALEILRAGTTDALAFDATRNVKRERVDVLDTEYFDPWHRVRGLGFYPSVIALIAPLLRAGDVATIERV